jgi:hypothetical protein
VSPTEVYGRPVPPNLDHTSNNKRRGLCTAINVYVNGEFFPGGLAELDHVAPVRDVLAVEAYPDVAFAPLQWRSNVGAMYPDGSPRQVCAVVVVWTSR